MEFEAELNEKFHNLPGATVGEKKKSLNAFVRTLNDKIPQETARNVFVKNLKPKHKLEAVFRVDLLLRYQIYDEVLELLKTGDPLHILRILKDWSFFRKTFPNMSGSTFVNDILSCVSFSTRVKIINRVSKSLGSEEIADEFFEAIEARYGISSAKIMLTSCSLPVIKAKIEQYNLRLKYKQVMTVVKRHTEFLDFHFGRTLASDFDYQSDRARLRHREKELARDSEFDSDYEQEKTNMVKAIYKNNEQLFQKLCATYSIEVSFGKHLSKKVLQGTDYIFKNLKKSHLEVHRRQVYQQLRKNPELFKRFVLERTSDDITQFCYNYTSSRTEIGYFIYPNISGGKRYKFLSDFFKEKFGFDLHDRPELISESILFLMPENIRENILDVKVRENEKLVYLYSPDVSIPRIMDEIKHSSDLEERVLYVNMLYKTCNFHKNEAYLLEVLKYVETGHKNDTNALEKLMDSLWHWKNIEDLSAEHWTYIDRMLKLLRLQNVTVRQKFFLEKRIIHLLNNNLEANEELQKYCEYLRPNKCFDQCFVETPKYRRMFILEMKKYIDKIEDKDERDSLLARYLRWVYQYNKSTSSRDDIPILDYLPLIQKFLKEDRLSDVKSIIAFYVRLHYKQFNPIVWEYRRDFFEEDTYERKKHSLFSWYLSHREDELLDKIELIFEFDGLKKNETFMRYLALYSFRNIPERLTELSVKTIQADVDISEKITALNVLSLLNPQEFLRISEPLRPPNADGKISYEDSPDRIKLQEGFLNSLPHLAPSADVLQIISSFCVGDYLKYALKALYSIISFVPEREAIAFLRRLHNSAVSVRKHTIHLGKFVFPLDDYVNFIIKESTSEKNASLKNILFQKSIEYAKILPTSKVWELIKATIHGIDKEDVEAHDWLLKIDQVPKEHRAAYISEAYAILEKSSVEYIYEKKFEFIKRIPGSVIDDIDCNLLKTFVEEVIFHDILKLREHWTRFVFYSTGEKRNFLFDFALTKLAEYNGRTADDVVDEKQSSHVKNFCKAVVKFRPSSSMVRKFATVWFSKFLPEVDIDCFLRVMFVATYADCHYDMKSFAAKTKELLETYVDCLELFADSLKAFLAHTSTVDVYEFVESFLMIQDSVPACTLSIRILSSKDPEDKEEALRYISIIGKLKDRSELSIKMYYRKYLYSSEMYANNKL